MTDYLDLEITITNMNIGSTKKQLKHYFYNIIASIAILILNIWVSQISQHYQWFNMLAIGAISMSICYCCLEWLMVRIEWKNWVERKFFLEQKQMEYKLKE